MKTLKRILLFVGVKIAELATIGGVLLFIFWLFSKYNNAMTIIWLICVGGIVLFGIFILLMAMIYANWDWVKRRIP